MPGSPAVEAKDEFIEVGLEVLAAQPVIDAQGPDLEGGKDPVHPGQYNMSGHFTDDLGIYGETILVIAKWVKTTDKRAHKKIR